MAFLLFLLLQISPGPKHLAVTTTSSAPAAARGAKISLFLDVAPNKGIHVYAPGAADYLPIAVKMDPHAGVAFADLKYPKSQVLTFAGDHVPVFQEPFRLVEEVTVGRAIKAGSTLTLTGNVTYQACDDRVCFIPATVPVRWTIAVK